MKKYVLFAAFFVAMLPQMAMAQFYRPQSVRMPLMDSKGTLEVDANIPCAVVFIPAVINVIKINNIEGEGGIIHRNVSVSYAFNDKWAAQLSNKTHYGGWTMEAMVGRFNPVGDKSVWELYGGYSFSTNRQDFVHVEQSSMHWDQDGFCHTLFVQGDIGLPSFRPSWSKKTWFTAGVGLRMGLVLCDYEKSWYDFVSSGCVYLWDMIDYEEGVNILGELQPMVKVGLGVEHWKCDLGLSCSFITSYKPLWTANMALSYRIPLKKQVHED